MEKINDDIIINSIEKNHDISYSILLLRLFEEYKKHNEEPNKDDEISLVKIQSAYKIINSEIIKQDKKDNYYLNEELSTSINKNFIILKNYMSNFDIKNRTKIQKTLNLITILESYLKLPITFPENIELCLEDVLAKESSAERDKQERGKVWKKK